MTLRFIYFIFPHLQDKTSCRSGCMLRNNFTQSKYVVGNVMFGHFLNSLLGEHTCMTSAWQHLGYFWLQL